MKTAVKFIGLLIIIAVIVVLIGGLVVSKHFQHEKSITIDKSQEIVWTHVSTFREMDRWSPWMQLDPNMISTISGIDGTVGAKQSWAGNDQVGSGSQEITGIDAPNRLETKLVFNEPYESEATSYINLKSVGQTTRVTWGFEVDIPYPFNFIMIFMNNEKAMDKEFGKGLTSLKAICES